MYDCYLTFRSITHAQKGSNLLTAAGFRHRMLRTPKMLSSQGCGYALQLARKDVEAAVQCLRSHHAVLQRIYWQHEDGSVEELVL